MTAAAPRAVVFDVGNVLVDWNPLYLYRQLIEDDAERRRFLNEICTMEWHHAHDRGVPMVNNAAPLIARYPEFEAAIRAWERRWPSITWPTTRAR